MGIQTSTINNGPVAGFKNRIINGNFDIWQRGTTTGTWVAPINSYYLCDRWLSQVGGTGGNGALTRQSFAVGQSEVPNNPTYFLRLNVTSAASGQTAGTNYLEQRIEDVTTLAGQQVTVSFWARGSGTLPGVFLSQTFGTGGSAQVNVTLVSNLVLSGGTTGAWTKYTYTTTLPSVSGKTIGTGSYVNLTFQLPLNAIYQIDLAQVQVEQGPIATTFEQRPLGIEVGLCQRYFVSTRSSSQFGLGTVVGPCVSLTSRVVVPQTLFPTVMRATPTVTVYSVSADTSGAVVLYNDSSTPVGSGFTITASSSRAMSTNCNGSSSLTIGNYYSFTYEASAEL